MEKELEFSEVFVGQRVLDKELNKTGLVEEIIDIHNVRVVYDSEIYTMEGSGLYCLDPTCKDYDPLYLAPPKTMLEELKEYFKKTPKEQIQADWDKSEMYDKIGPTVEEFLKNTKNQQK